MDITVVPDIPQLSMTMASVQTASDVSTALLADQLDQFTESNEQLTKMMELSVNPNVGGNFDMSV